MHVCTKIEPPTNVGNVTYSFSVQLEQSLHIPPCTGISHQTSNMSSFEWQHLKSEPREVKIINMTYTHHEKRSPI